MADLRQLRQEAGNPSFRQLAARSGAVSHATLHLTVTGHRLQPWETVREFVRACGGDETAWRARWQAAQDALANGEEHAGHADDVAADPGEAAVTSGAESDPDREAVGRPSPEVIAGERPRRWRWSTALLVSAAVCVIAVVAVRALDRNEDTPAAASGSPGAVHEGDSSDFLGDVTIPDGTVVRPDEQFVKVWLIRNDGSVYWRDRYLERVDPANGPNDCRTPERVPISDTPPQRNVQISVVVRAPATAPASCKVDWKMVDESGRELLPGYRPVFFQVRVRR